MNFDRNVLISTLVVLGLVIVSAVGITWYIMRPQSVVETPAAAVKQADGSEVLARQPDALAKPAMRIPTGGKVERTVEVTVQPDAHFKLPALPGQHPTDQACPPVSVDLALVRMPDQTRRVVASSKDGQIIAGVDVPIETAAIDAPHYWAAGLSYNPIMQTPGIWAERDIGRVRLGMELNQTRIQMGGPPAAEARIRVGITF